MKHQIAVIAGDGIGREVVPEAKLVLEQAGARWGFEFEWTAMEWSSDYYLSTGKMMPEDGLEQLRQHDAIFLGAVGDPRVPDHVTLWGLLIPIRRAFQQYVNFRPIRLFQGIDGPLKHTSPSDIDMVIVRENNEGEYSEIGGRIYHGTPEEIVVQQSTFTRRGVERIIKYAFELARSRSGRLASATKSNGIIHTMPFWDEIFHEQARQYPDVQTQQYHIDALAAKFVLAPAQLDVIVASNLFGDILSDLGAAIAGSIGIAPSANLNPEHDHPSLFEPVHGSAPDIAGQQKANPIGQIWSGALMLEHLGHPEAARALVAAIEEVLAHTNVRTPDLGGRATTHEVTLKILEVLEHRG
ncbi:MAG TPA: tartrate dehydrogenase [Ktedonobacteraceae bacterium]|nr:tartrate dehydrogenase [Ktedonobacteraceae bacterium]